jgi:hypothetical protein
VRSWQLPLCASSLPPALGVAKGTSTPCSPRRRCQLDGGARCGRGDSHTVYPYSGGSVQSDGGVGHDLGVVSLAASRVIPTIWPTPTAAPGAPTIGTARGARTPPWSSRWHPTPRVLAVGSPREAPPPSRHPLAPLVMVRPATPCTLHLEVVPSCTRCHQGRSHASCY